jgi:hypothetical protein
MRLPLLLAALVLAPAAALASPPPPPEFVSRAGAVLADDLTPQTFDAYAAAFADDLHVFVDGREVAPDKATWLQAEKRLLGKVERHVLGGALGRDNLLLVDEYDDRSDVPPNPNFLADPRFVTRALRFSFGPDHLVHELRIVQGGGFWMSAASLRPGR